MRSIRGRLIFSTLIALGAILLTWILLGDSSPFAGYFSAYRGLRNLSLALNVLPFIVSAMLSGSHGGGPTILFTVLQFIQWFLIAFVLSTLLLRVFKRA